jgi:pre-rRNA-processing protein TSR3
MNEIKMTLAYPPTIIIRHPKESPKKCSIIALKGRPDVRILLHPIRKLPPLEGYIRLCEDGPPLTEADRASGILLLDSSWRRVRAMLEGVEQLPVRSLQGYQTAFPRVSHLGTDPDNGLASVEAIYLAYHILGRPTEGLLDHYRWAEEFLRVNSLPSDKISHSDVD